MTSVQRYRARAGGSSAAVSSFATTPNARNENMYQSLYAPVERLLFCQYNVTVVFRKVMMRQNLNRPLGPVPVTLVYASLALLCERYLMIGFTHDQCVTLGAFAYPTDSNCIQKPGTETKMSVCNSRNYTSWSLV